MSETEIKRKITVIFATDVVGYSKHMEAHESDTVRSLRECEAIMGELFQKHGGRLFNTGGDSFLAEFSSAVDAVECGVEFQTAMQARNKLDTTAVKLEFRIGINSGDVVKDNHNLLGDGVNIAARLEALAQTNGITISKIIHDFVSGKTSYEFADLGTQKVKENEFRAFDLILEGTERRSSEISGSEYDFESKVGDRPAVLILPFENQTGKSDNDFIGFGITSNIISTLSINDSILVSSSSTGKYVQEKNYSDSEILENYGIQYLLRGDVQGAEGAYRVSLQMTDLKKSEVVWSKLFDFKELKELFPVQEKISIAILEQMRVKTSGSQLTQKNYFTNPEAYRHFLNAWAAFGLKTVEGSEKAEKLWKKAIELDPNHRRLNFMMAWVHWRKVTMRMSDDPKRDMEKAYSIALNTNETCSSKKLFDLLRSKFVILLNFSVNLFCLRQRETESFLTMSSKYLFF